MVRNRVVREPRRRGECHFCGDPVSESFHCFGCGKHVCARCDMTRPYGPRHTDVDHHRWCPLDVASTAREEYDPRYLHELVCGRGAASQEHVMERARELQRLSGGRLLAPNKGDRNG
jgi:hypothetical protein